MRVQAQLKQQLLSHMPVGFIGQQTIPKAFEQVTMAVAVMHKKIVNHHLIVRSEGLIISG